MFYEAAEINKQLTCPYCKNKYNDPRIVECCSSFCMSCIQILKCKNKYGFKCPECSDFHEQPEKGYLKNPNLAYLCEISANEVSRGSLADTLRTQLDEIKLKLNELSNENELGVDKIK